jgi:hypothetical protein
MILESITGGRIRHRGAVPAVPSLAPVGAELDNRPQPVAAVA